MSEQTMAFDRDARRVFVAQQIMFYREKNPHVRKLIYKIWDVASAGNDFLAAMWPIFMGLENVKELLGEFPPIQEATLNKTWSELHEAPDDILDDEAFDDFRIPIESEFRLQLNVSVTSPEVKRRTERTFAMILRMIQIERAKQAETD